MNASEMFILTIPWHIKSFRYKSLSRTSSRYQENDHNLTYELILKPYTPMADFASKILVRWKLDYFVWKTWLDTLTSMDRIIELFQHVYDYQCLKVRLLPLWIWTFGRLPVYCFTFPKGESDKNWRLGHK